MAAVLRVGIFSIRGDVLFFSAAHFSRHRSGKLSNAKKKNFPKEVPGAGEVTRTPDLLITNQLLYQLSHSSRFTAFTLYQTSLQKSKNIRILFVTYSLL